MHYRVHFTDGNLAFNESQPYSDSRELEKLNLEQIMDKWGTSIIRRRRRGAEVLVPQVVERSFIREVRAKDKETLRGLPDDDQILVTYDEDIFYWDK